MEYILLFIDFLRTREKRIFLVNVIIPLIVSIIVFLYLKSASNLNGNLKCSKELEHYAS